MKKKVQKTYLKALRRKSKAAKTKSSKKFPKSLSRKTKSEPKKEKISDKNGKESVQIIENGKEISPKSLKDTQKDPELYSLKTNDTDSSNSGNANSALKTLPTEKNEKASIKELGNGGGESCLAAQSSVNKVQFDALQRTLSSNKSQMPIVPEETKIEPETPFRLAEHISEVFKQPSYIQDMMIPIPLPPPPPIDPDDEFGQTTFNFHESRKQEKYSVMNLLKYTIRRAGDNVPQNETQMFNYNSNLRKYSCFNPEERTAIPDLIPAVEFEEPPKETPVKHVFLCPVPTTFQTKEVPSVQESIKNLPSLSETKDLSSQISNASSSLQSKESSSLQTMDISAMKELSSTSNTQNPVISDNFPKEHALTVESKSEK